MVQHRVVQIWLLVCPQTSPAVCFFVKRNATQNSPKHTSFEGKNHFLPIPQVQTGSGLLLQAYYLRNHCAIVYRSTPFSDRKLKKNFLGKGLPFQTPSRRGHPSASTAPRSLISWLAREPRGPAPIILYTYVQPKWKFHVLSYHV